MFRFEIVTVIGMSGMFSGAGSVCSLPSVASLRASRVRAQSPLSCDPATLRQSSRSSSISWLPRAHLHDSWLAKSNCHQGHITWTPPSLNMTETGKSRQPCRRHRECSEESKTPPSLSPRLKVNQSTSKHHRRNRKSLSQTELESRL